MIRFNVVFCSADGTWAVIDNHRDNLPYAWFVDEDKAKAYCEYENNNYYYPW